jgi:hypothetical protein
MVVGGWPGFVFALLQYTYFTMCHGCKCLIGPSMLASDLSCMAEEAKKVRLLHQYVRPLHVEV